MLVFFFFFFNLEMLGVLMMGWVLSGVLFSEEEYSFFVKNSDVNFWLMILVIVLYLMMMSVEISYKFSLNLLFIVLFMLMQLSNLMVFFFLYEMVFILIMFVIVLLGYSYERLFAAFLMMFYSFVFSSPVLMMMFILDFTFLMKEWLNFNIIMMYFLVGSFMVKFPIFGFHYWLPVAHVEASTVGSMLLAGVLLKLGALGLVYIVMYMKFMVKWHWLGLSVLILMMMIVGLSDLKMMIAYSSIAHMTLVFYVLMTGVSVGKKGAIMMMFYHGFLSPLMFWVVGMLGWWKTRSLIVLKLMSFSSLFILVLFFVCIMNMGFPPFMGFLSEVLMLKVFVQWNFMLWVVVLSVLFSCYYNVYLFWCFTNSMGMVFKLNFYSLDLFLVLFFVMFLNF